MENSNDLFFPAYLAFTSNLPLSQNWMTFLGLPSHKNLYTPNSLKMPKIFLKISFQKNNSLQNNANENDQIDLSLQSSVFHLGI